MKRGMTRRDFIRVSGLTGLITSASVSGLSCPGFPVSDSNASAEFFEITYGPSGKKLRGGLWYNPDFSGERPLIISSHGFGASAVDLGTLHNYLANKGYVILAPDHKDFINLSSSEELRNSHDYKEIENNFGSLENYVNYVLFTQQEGKKESLINLHIDVLNSLFFDTINKIKAVPGYEDIDNFLDFYILLNRSFMCGVKNERVISILGEAMYGTRVNDTSTLADFSLGDNFTGNNPDGVNIIDEMSHGKININPESIGGLGYSLGGGTMLQLIGAGDIPEREITYKDPRFEGIPMVLIAPTSGPSYYENFPGIRNDILWMGGDEDNLIKGIARTQPLTNGSKETIFFWNSGHLAFSDTICSRVGSLIVNNSPLTEQLWGNCESYESIVQDKNKYASLFFKRSLGKEKQTELIDEAESNPNVRFATDLPIDEAEFEEAFPGYKL